MNKNYINISMIISIILIIIICFSRSNIISLSALESTQIFLTKVFPFLFIMMILNFLLISLNLPYYLSKLVPNPYFYIFVMSLFSGSPVNGVIISSFIEKKFLTTKEASAALCFSTLNNPLFLYNYFKIIFNDSLIITKLFLIIYLLNFIIFIFFTLRYKPQKCTFNKENFSFQKNLIKAITSSLQTLLNIFAIITFFKIICDLLLPYQNSLTILIKGSIEITQGLNLMINANITSKTKELLALVILTFSGFSIHIQISNILSKYNINYKYFYISRFILIISEIIIIFST